MKVAIVGTGLQAVRRAQVLAESTDCQLVAIAGTSAEAATAFGLRFGVDRVFTSWQTMIEAADVDVVIVATPPDLHHAVALHGLRRGLHVLCEKPLARTTAEAHSMVAAARDAGGVLWTGFNHRFHPAALALREALNSQRLGVPHWARAAYGIGARPGYAAEWRANPSVVGGGQLMEQGIHVVDLVRWLVAEVVEVTSVLSTATVPMNGLESDAHVLLKCVGDVPATIHSSLTQWQNLFRFEVGCEGGIYEWRGLGGSYGEETLTTFVRSDGPFQETVQRFRGADASWRNEWAAFVAAASHFAPDLSSAEDGLQAMKVVEAAYAGTERWVRVEPPPSRDERRSE